MNNINALIAIDVAVAKKLRDNFTLVDPNNEDSGTIRNDLTSAQKRKFSMVYEGKWNKVTFGGTTYIPLLFNIPDTTVGEKQDPQTDDATLHWIEKFKELLPGKEFVVGAWNMHTGAQYGTAIVPATYDENGDEVTPETITGIPFYPIHARAVEIMPPIEVWDYAVMPPVLVSSTPATKFKQLMRLQGQPDWRI